MGVAAAAIPRGARRGPAERALLRGRPGAAHLPAAVLVAGARRGHPRSLATLRINYRTSHQIRQPGGSAAGAGGEPTSTATSRAGRGTDLRRSTARSRDGSSASTEARREAVADWIARARRGGRAAARDRRLRALRGRARSRAAAVEAAGLPFAVLDEQVERRVAARVDQHDAPREGPRVPRRRRDGVRRRGDPVCRSGSRQSPTTPTSRRSTTPSGTCCTSRARGRGTTCW